MEPRLEPFDFDSWSHLARRDPGAFESRRQAAIEAFMARQAPDRRERLRRLQWRIDRERERSGNPLGACRRLSDLMWRSFAGQGGLVEHLHALQGTAPPPSRRRAQILRFRPRR
ncbi:DUF3135 domain-containing protein [Spiribacter halobius]|nr:DUF3135 domain-containing protein [Spiribacter halobius]UEX78338.1 DUF3135 domain-containing protein [Spiribacter halobius]